MSKENFYVNILLTLHFFTIEKPNSAVCLEIYYGDSALRGFIS